MCLFSFPRVSWSILPLIGLSLPVRFLGRHAQRPFILEACLAKLMLICRPIESLPLRGQVPVAGRICGENFLPLDVGALT